MASVERIEKPQVSQQSPVEKKSREKKKMYSPDYSGLKKYLYIFLRLAHMFFSFSILPVCLLYVRQQHAFDYSGFILWLMVFGAVLWSMLYLVLSQFAYPESLSGALMATGGLYASGLTGANLGEFNLWYAAYSVAWCALTAQVLFFWGITLGGWIPAIRNKYFGEIEIWYRNFLLICALALTFFCWFVHPPFLKEVRSENSQLMLLLFFALFIWQVAAEMQVLYRGSAINGAAFKQGENTWNLFESYVGYVALGLITSLVSPIIVAVW